MLVTIYRANFLFMLFQSILNTFLIILSVDFIYGSVESIAGWSKPEMIVLICTAQIINQLYRAFISPSHGQFASSIINGNLDKCIIRPLSMVFQVNTGRMNVSAFFSLVAPVTILCMQIGSMSLQTGFLSIFLYLFFLLNGIMVITSFMLVLYSLAFIFVNVTGIGNIYYTLMGLAEKPKEMYFNRWVMLGLVLIIPILPLANTPALVLLNEASLLNMLLGILSSLFFTFLSVTLFKMIIRKYTSASS
jgi:ABC-2 type transport system permease protein